MAKSQFLHGQSTGSPEKSWVNADKHILQQMAFEPSQRITSHSQSLSLLDISISNLARRIDEITTVHAKWKQDRDQTDAQCYS